MITPRTDAELIEFLQAQLATLTAERDAAENQCASAERFANQEGLRADAAEAQLAALTAEGVRLREQVEEKNTKDLGS